MTTFTKEFNAYYPNGKLFTFWKGRVALYCFLKSLNLSTGDEVILPALTCVVVPNAIIYAGLKPIYIDIEPDSFNMDPKKIKEKITSKTRVVIMQNTFGLSSNVEDVIAIAKQHDLITIDDCTHGFGGHYKGKPNGSLADVAFYSSQWNKPFSTVIGGYLVINNPKYVANVKNEYQSYNMPTIGQNLKILILFYIKKYALFPKTYWVLIRLYRWLSKKNLIMGSSQGSEISSIIKPANYEMQMGWGQQKIGTRQIKQLSNTLKLRQKNAKQFTNWLEANGKISVKSQYHQNHSWLKYPIRVLNRAEFIKRAASSNIMLGDWFVSPIHPVKSNWTLWHYQAGTCEHAEKAAKELVNLPMDVLNTKPLLNFLEENQDMIC